MPPLVYQRFESARRFALGVFDGFARALGASPSATPLGDLNVELTAQTAPVARVFDPPLSLWTQPNQSNLLLLDGTHAAPARTGARLPLGAGDYTARVHGRYYQELTFSLRWPPQGSREIDQVQVGPDLELSPGPAYPFAAISATPFQLGPTVLRGTLFTPSGAPLPGALVEVLNLVFSPPWPFIRCLTDERGDWAIALPGRRRFRSDLEIPNPPAIIRQTFTLRFTAPQGGPALTWNEPDVLLGSEHTLHNTALRGRVVGAAGRPIPGASIATSLGPLTSLSRADGQWSLYLALDQAGVPSVTATATTPDGARTSTVDVSVVRGATIVVPTFQFP